MAQQADSIRAVIGPPNPELASLIRRHSETIIRAWEKRACEALPGAGVAPELVLIDFLSESLEEIAGNIERQQTPS